MKINEAALRSIKQWIRKKSAPVFGQLFFGALSFFLLAGCSVDSAKNHYSLGERLWMDGKYEAAVIEFEKASSRDPKGELGTQSLYRAATTQELFLSQYGEAARKFRSIAQAFPQEPLGWAANQRVGEILFVKTQQYDQVIRHYQKMLQIYPGVPETAQFLYRIAKSWFYLFQFSEALEGFEKIRKQFPDSPWAEKALFEIATTYFTRGDADKHALEGSALGKGKTKILNDFEVSKQNYQEFIEQYPESKLVIEAEFGIASCLEEMNELTEAHQRYQRLQGKYPSQKVIQVKLRRIEERMQKREGRGSDYR